MSSREIVAAESLEELRRRVDAWYADAAANGGVDVRNPWREDGVKETESGFFEFEVWAEPAAGG